MSELTGMCLGELAARIVRAEVSPLEVMRAVLDRIQTTNCKLNAFVATRDGDLLLEEARRAEGRVARGQARPLDGIPFGVKDLEDVAGMVTSYGCKVFRDNVARQDSTLVQRLRAAGAIVVGKTNTPEFGYTALTKNLLFGVTRNPWNLERTPGGSSGGSAAAIAGGIVPLVTASDGGGSIRIPASFTGCFGLKPSYGRIPRGPDPLWVTADTAVSGPITRTVEDAALYLDMVVGPHPLDPNSLPHPGLSYRAVLGRLPKKLRMAFSPDLGYAVVQVDIARVVEEAAHVFERLGHIVEPIRDGLCDCTHDWGMLGAFELFGELEPLLAQREQEFGRAFVRTVRLGSRMTPAQWTAGRRRREEVNRWCAALFERYDLLLTPTVPYDPPPARGPFPDDLAGKPMPIAGAASFTIPFNLSWHPAATVRAGFSDAGLPVGLQIVGPRHRDDLVLQASYAFEQARPWARQWPEI